GSDVTENLRRRRTQSLFFLTFVLLLVYMVLSVTFAGELSWFSSEIYDNEDKLPLSAPTAKIAILNTTVVQLNLHLLDEIHSNENAKDNFSKLTTIAPSKTTTQTDAEFTADPSEVACRVPKMDPFDSSIKHLINDPEPVNCEVMFPTLFKFSDSCYPVSLMNSTVVPTDHEFLAILCEQLIPANASNTTEKNSNITKIVDMHAMVHLKANVEERLKHIRDHENEDSVNVLVLGLDGVSHMNFLRTMPKSYSYLMEELGAVEMHGFNKIGDNTYPNVVAALTSKNELEVNSTCKNDKAFDDCPFIWKTFSKHGYRTAFGEDSTWMGGFNYLTKGFIKPPTDYYLRPFGVAAEEHIAHHKELNAKLCYGPRLSMQVLLDYTQKFAFSMGNDKRYFQFIWSTSLTHDDLNYGRMGDQHLLSTLDWFHTEGYLNQTVLIFLSDHGLRWGDIIEYPQGQLEERIPFLFFVVPHWFKEKYARAYKNLQGNQDRLTTPYDLFETLRDLVTLQHITGEEIGFREADLEIAAELSSLPRGISQFLPIPLSRTCESAAY
ncbi:hypothetical protein Ocin01_11035, partial [Orchesella cincta]